MSDYMTPLNFMNQPVYLDNEMMDVLDAALGTDPLKQFDLPMLCNAIMRIYTIHSMSGLSSVSQPQ
jgi:hypothetical protein